MSGSSGGFQAPRGRASQKSSGASSGQAATLASPSTVPRSPLRGARTPNIFAAFAEDGKEAEDVPVATGATFQRPPNGAVLIFLSVLRSIPIGFRRICLQEN